MVVSGISTQTDLVLVDSPRAYRVQFMVRHKSEQHASQLVSPPPADGVQENHRNKRHSTQRAGSGDPAAPVSRRLLIAVKENKVVIQDDC